MSAGRPTVPLGVNPPPVIELRDIGFRYRGQAPPEQHPVRSRPEHRNPALPAREPPGPERAVPGRHVPSQPVPGQPAPGQPAPAQPAPGQPAPAQPVPGQPALSWAHRRRRARHWRSKLPAPALSGVDLTVLAGELVTLTGPARAGRSTLLAVLGLRLKPTTGRYLLDGIDTTLLRDRDRAALRGGLIGFVAQPVCMLPDRSVLDNVALGLLYSGLPARQRRSLAAVALDRVSLADRALATARQLSVGELQLAGLARALVTEPTLLLADDPTAGLDPERAARVIALLTALRSEGVTVVIASRDQLAAAHSSRCVRIGPARDPAR